MYLVLRSLFPGTSTHATTPVIGKTSAICSGLELLQLLLIRWNSDKCFGIMER